MAQSSVLTAQKRAGLGSRRSRQLRAANRIPANIQGEGDHVDISIEEHEFLATRRAHVHLYDIDSEGTPETAVVRELELVFVGTPKSGILNHLVDHLTISCLPSLIPDNLKFRVDHLEEGDHIKASDMILPEGVTLVDADMDVASLISAERPDTGDGEEEEEGEEGGAASSSATPE